MPLNGLAAIQEIDSFQRMSARRGEKLTSSEIRDLNIVRRDAIHSLLQQQDAWLFSEFDRLKLVELEYLYQVRGVRQVMPSAIFREGYEGYGNSWTGSKIRLLYPQDRKRGGRESREPFLPINILLETVNITEQLAPLRIDLQTEKYRLKDRILWNVDDTTIPLKLFVENVLEDYSLPLSLAPEVCKSLQEQISNHLPHIYPVPPSSDFQGLGVTPAQNTTNGKSTITEGGGGSKAESLDIESLGLETSKDELETTKEEPIHVYPAKTPTDGNLGDPMEIDKEPEPYDEDLRIAIKLDITIGQHQLIDQFEWDINSPESDPEMFGLILANELSLPLEFSTAISHAIREQSQAYTKALFSSGYQFDGKPPRDPQLQNETAMPVGDTSFLRRPELLPLFSPSLNEFQVAGLDPDDQEAEKREMRSRRRQGRSSRRNHYGHHHHHDTRAGAPVAAAGDAVNIAHDPLGPDVCTPFYSGVLPGGLDRNLSILHMTVCHNDDSYGGEKQDLAYYFHKHRRERKAITGFQFGEEPPKLNKPKWIVKLKLPK